MIWYFLIFLAGIVIGGIAGYLLACFLAWKSWNDYWDWRNR